MAVTIPQHKLRNEIGAILRLAERGERFTVTVNGRPTAELGPLPTAGLAPAGTVAKILAQRPPDPELAEWLRGARAEERAAVGEA